MEAPTGWYPDPQAEADERYWDGSSWTDQTRQEQRIVNPGSTDASGSSLDKGSTVAGEAAVLASMSYLHAIALVVISGVVVGFGVALGLLFQLAFEAEVPAAIFFVLGGAVGIAMLVASIVALLRADADRARTRGRN